MVTCHICNAEVGPGNRSEMYHNSCGDEWRRRRAEGRCVKCGTEDAAQNRIWCSRCREAYAGTGGQLPWLGYARGGV